MSLSNEEIYGLLSVLANNKINHNLGVSLLSRKNLIEMLPNMGFKLTHNGRQIAESLRDCTHHLEHYKTRKDFLGSKLTGKTVRIEKLQTPNKNDPTVTRCPIPEYDIVLIVEEPTPIKMENKHDYFWGGNSYWNEGSFDSHHVSTDSEYQTWVTGNGRVLYYHEIENGHFVIILHYLRRKSMEIYQSNWRRGVHCQYASLYEEAKKRGIKLKACLNPQAPTTLLGRLKEWFNL